MESFGRVAIRGAAVTGIAQGVKILVSMLLVVILARLLTPSDFGIVAMTEPISGFVLLFQNFGISAAVIQARILTDEQKNALFNFNILASVIIGAIFLISVPAISWFYHDARPGYLLAANALNVVVGGVSIQYLAHFNRDLRFTLLAKIDIVKTLVVAAVSVGSALVLHNYWAIWLGSFAGVVWCTVIAWGVSDWQPARKFAFGSAGALLKFGMTVTSSSIISFIVRNADNVMIAKARGAVELGYYDRAYKLMLLPLSAVNQPLSAVFLPLLGKLAEQPQRYRAVYLRAIRALSALMIPGILSAAAVSGPLIHILLGERWSAVSPIFTYLALAVAVQPVTATNNWLFITTGRAGSMLRWTMIGGPISLSLMLIGLHWGALGVAMGYAIAEYIKTPILIARYTASTPVSAADVYHALLPSLVGGLAGWWFGYAVLSGLADIPRIVATTLACYGFSLALHFSSVAGRHDLIIGLTQIRLGLAKKNESFVDAI